MRVKKRNRKRIVEKLSTLSEAKLFDSYFWQSAGPQARFVATWNAIKEFYEMRGISGYKLRLQRSVQNIKQA